MRKAIHVDCISCKVKDCPIAHYCSIGWKNKINSGKIVSSYRKNQPVVKEGTAAAGIYIIHSGRVLIVSEREGTGRHIIRLAGAGDILEHESVDGQIRNPFTAEAFEDSLVCFIPKAAFFELLNEDRQFTLHLENFYTEKFIKAEERLKNALIMNTHAKIADALLIVADSFNGKIPFSRKELGELVGISADQVSRELKKLMDEHIINKTGQNKTIVLKEVSKLLDIVREFDENYYFSGKLISLSKDRK